MGSLEGGSSGGGGWCSGGGWCRRRRALLWPTDM